MRCPSFAISFAAVLVGAGAAGACSTQTPQPATAGKCAVAPKGDGTTSADVLAAQGPNCLSCAAASGCLDPATGGGCCEIVSGTVASAGLTESELCLNTMNDIFNSKCATFVGAHLDLAKVIEPGCLCGMESDICVTGSQPPAGPIYADYAADFGPDAATIDTDFIGAKFGAGQANDVIECALNSGCDCFGPGALDGGPDDGADAGPATGNAADGAAVGTSDDGGAGD